MSDFEQNYKGGLVHAETWNDYLEYRGGNISFVGYLEANEHVVEEMESVLQKANDFEQLKSELLNFIEKRKQFLSYANENCP